MSYCSINPHFDNSKNKIELNILFNFFQSFELESEGIESIFPNQILLHNLVCTVILKSSNNPTTKEYIFERNPKKIWISNSDNLLMTCLFSSQEIEELNIWRNGGNITINWQFNGNGQVEQGGNIYLVNLLTFFDSNFRFPIINEDQWSSIINTAGLDKKYIVEFSLKYSDSIKEKTNPFLSQISTDLNTMIIKLNDAVFKLRESHNSSDYKAVLGEVKGALDSFKDFQLNPSISGKFLLDTKTFKDIDPGGGQIASEEVMGRIKGIVKNVYMMASKSLHTENEGTRFSMEPDREDALLMLEISLSLYNYFVEKSKKVN
jgi:hypothetical protein